MQIFYVLLVLQNRKSSASTTKFFEAALVKSLEYRHFWADLADGRFKSGRYKRIGKHDAEVWIQATYNPILDLDGKPYKVVKYAVDITEQVDRENLISEKVESITHILMNCRRR
jgi:methyl-accepting chemotaxis protein